MEIIIKTAAYAENKNYNAIFDGLTAQGFKATTKTWPENGVAIETDAPRSALNQITFSKTAVRIKAAA